MFFLSSKKYSEMIHDLHRLHCQQIPMEFLSENSLHSIVKGNT